jgi:hypothetical protein
MNNGLERVMSPDTHLMYEEYGREGRMVIVNVKGDGLTMERLKSRSIGVVDKHEFLNLCLVL